MIKGRAKGKGGRKGRWQAGLSGCEGGGSGVVFLDCGVYDSGLFFEFILFAGGESMKIGFIGCGKMAEAMISSLIQSKIVGPHELFVSDVSGERRRVVKGRYGLNVYSRNNVICDMADILFLAVKPQNLGAVQKEIAEHVTERHLAISIAAGKTIAFLENGLPAARVIRVMPNLPCTVGEGMSVLCAGSRATAKDRRNAQTLLGSFGRVMELPEDMFDAVTAVSGSGPAFFAYYLEKMIASGVKAGLKREDAIVLAEQTMLGTSRLLIERNITPDELIKAVASSKGTTSEGLAALEKSDMNQIMDNTITAAARRSRELSS